MTLNCIELFAGAGGLALGFARAGFQHRALLETDAYACQTLQANSDWPVVQGDSHEIDWTPYFGKIQLLSAGAPCQPFSIGGMGKGDTDNRNLFPEIVRATREILPEAILLENVRGLGRPAFTRYLQYILNWLKVPHVRCRRNEKWESHEARVTSAIDAGESHYRLYGPVVINSADFGAPQIRQRLFVVGFREELIPSDAWRWPQATHTREALLWDQLHGNYWDEHGLARCVPPCGRLRCTRAWKKKLTGAPRPDAARWLTVRDALASLPDPKSPSAKHLHGHTFVATRATLYEGHNGNILDWPAKTVKAGVHGVPGGEGIVALDNGNARRLTVRETARLQTFPDEWEFAGSRSHAFRQLGNAVTVVVAEAVANAIRTVLTHPTTISENHDG